MGTEISELPILWLLIFVVILIVIILINPWYLVIIVLLGISWIAIRKYVFKSA